MALLLYVYFWNSRNMNLILLDIVSEITEVALTSFH